MSYRYLSHGLDPRSAAYAVPGGEAVGEPSVVVTGPEPLDVPDVRDFVVAGEEDDVRLDSLITSTRSIAERRYGLAIVEQTVTATFRGPAEYVELPRGPASVVVSVALIDASGVETAQDVTRYYLEGRRPVRLRLAGGLILPSASYALRVVYEAGYESGSVPPEIVQALRIAVSDLFDGRSGHVVGTTVVTLPTSAESILASYATHAI